MTLKEFSAVLREIFPAEPGRFGRKNLSELMGRFPDR
jgi:hypothetical protein